ncbi:SCP-like protein [Necator americanus]|uniref:SCP-like protein n=1 Tax=Necator americanus TaxID=51031 RepID=W2TND4_NECAM|nr:SCP-like protein [Necator americanus]ETN82517.1 SCP-like protein [Necator americanus]
MNQAPSIKVYDCAVESSAIRSAKTCTGEWSDPSTRPGLKENYNKVKDELTTSGVAEKVSQCCILLLSSLCGWLLFRRCLFDGPPQQYKAWLRYQKMQCFLLRRLPIWRGVRFYAIANKTDVITYKNLKKLRGDVVGKDIYEIGAVCSKCPGGTTCDSVVGLCERTAASVGAIAEAGVSRPNANTTTPSTRAPEAMCTCGTVKVDSTPATKIITTRTAKASTTPGAKSTTPRTAKASTTSTARKTTAITAKASTTRAAEITTTKSAKVSSTPVARITITRKAKVSTTSAAGKTTTRAPKPGSTPTARKTTTRAPKPGTVGKTTTREAKPSTTQGAEMITTTTAKANTTPAAKTSTTAESGTTPTEPLDCSDYAGMSTSLSKEVRQSFIQKHNALRSNLARGREKNGKYELAPPAANIQKMKYDCAIEASALNHAKTCSTSLSHPSDRPGLKENIIHIKSHDLDEVTAASKAMDKWWSELAVSGVRSDMLFTSRIRHRISNIVTHWSKMAWHYNSRLGCAIHRCKKTYSVVCHYGPGGNVVGEYIYRVGAVCSACPSGTRCDKNTGLCV